MKRSIKINGRQTSIALEDEFWDALKEVAVSYGVSRVRLIEDLARLESANLSSSIRVFVLRHFREPAN